MNGDDNPFAPSGNSSGYGTANVGYGETSIGSAPQAPQAMQSAASAGQPGELIKETSTAGFPIDVIAESQAVPVLIDFWAPWCGPCKQLTPILENAVRKAGGKVKLVKMNIDDHPSIPGQMGVQSIPAVIAFVGGKPVDGFMGAKSESEVTAFIDKISNAAGADDQEAMVKEALVQAQAAIDAGDINQAAQVYQTVLQHAPDNADAYAALAGLMADYGQPEQAQGMLDQAPEQFEGHPGLAGVKAKLELAEKVAALGDPEELNKRLAENPKDHDAAFDLAHILNAQDDRQGAADLLLAIMEMDRQWRDDGARKELLIFFEAWGPMDEATQAARRKLSSLLFR